IAPAADVVCTAKYLRGVAVAGTVVGATGAVVASTASGVCPNGSCAIDVGTDVTLTAPTIAGARFTGWTGHGGCTGTDATLVLANVQASKSCTAQYVARRTFSVAVEGGAPGTVTVTSTAPFADCSATTCTVDVSSHVTVQQIAPDGFQFQGWIGSG